MNDDITLIQQYRTALGTLNVATERRDMTRYRQMRDDMVIRFLPHSTYLSKATETQDYRNALDSNDDYLESILYGAIWDELIPNEQLAIEHLYYEDETLVDEATRFYEQLHAYVQARALGDDETAQQHLKHALWEILYNTLPDTDNDLERDKTKRRRRAQAAMLNSLDIPIREIHTPDYIVAPIRQAYANRTLEDLLPDIAFPLQETARTIAAEIRTINADLQAQLLGQKSIVTDATNTDDATDAFVELTETIVSNTYKKIEEEIAKQARQGKTEAEIIDYLEEEISRYQGDTIPQKIEMLAHHYHGKLSEIDMRARGEGGYVWISLDDDRVRPRSCRE